MGHDQVRPRCTRFFRVLANKAGIKLGEHVLWRRFFGSELAISGKQLCGWPDDLLIQHFSEMDYHKHTTEDWQQLWAVCSQKTLEIVDVDANRLLANALVVTRCGDIVLLKANRPSLHPLPGNGGMMRLEVIPMSLSYNLLLHAKARARFSLSLFLPLFSRDNDSLVIMSSPQQ